MFEKIKFKRFVQGNAVINHQFIDDEILIKVPVKARAVKVEDRTQGTYKVNNIFSLTIIFGKDDELEFNFLSSEERKQAMIKLRIINNDERPMARPQGEKIKVF